MKDKITLGKAGKIHGEIADVAVEYDAGTAIEPEKFDVAMSAAKNNLKAWGFDNSLTVNAAVLELKEHTMKLLNQPGQFFILTEDELDAVQFLSCLFESLTPFFVNEDAISSGVLHTRRGRLPTEGVSPNTRSFPNSENEQDYALILAQFLNKENLPMILSTLGVFCSGRPESIETIGNGMVNSEDRDESVQSNFTVQRRFLARAIIALYHDWLSVTNPERCKKFNWNLPPLAIRDLADLRRVSTFFFKALPALRETQIAALVSPDQLFKLIPNDKPYTPRYPLLDATSVDIESELGDLIMFISANSPDCDDYDVLHADMSSREKPTPINPTYWLCHKENPQRAAELARACRRLDYSVHDLTDLAALIITFKWRSGALAGGRSYMSEVIEFVRPNGRSGMGFNFAETGCATVAIKEGLIRQGEAATFNPLLRAFTMFIEENDHENTSNAAKVKRAFHRGGWTRTDRRLKLFTEWFGKPLFLLEARWL